MSDSVIIFVRVASVVASGVGSSRSEATSMTALERLASWNGSCSRYPPAGSPLVSTTAKATSPSRPAIQSRAAATAFLPGKAGGKGASTTSAADAEAPGAGDAPDEPGEAAACEVAPPSPSLSS